jgi:hypothetical protein
MSPAEISALSVGAVAVLAWIGAAVCFRNLRARARRGLTLRDPATKLIYRVAAALVTCGILGAVATVLMDYWV